MKKNTTLYLIFIILSSIFINATFCRTTYAYNNIHTCYEDNIYCPIGFDIKANVNYTLTNDANYVEYLNYRTSDENAIFNYLILDKDNSIFQESIKASSSITLYRENTVILSSTIDAKIYLPCYLVDNITITDETPCETIRIKKGETYDFSTNISFNMGYKLVTNVNDSNNIKYDLLYSQGGNYTSGYLDSTEDLIIDLYKSFKFTYTSGLEDLLIFIPKSKFNSISYKKLSQPIFYKFIGNLGDNFQFSTPLNSPSSSLIVTSANKDNNQKFSYVQYDDENSYKYIYSMGRPSSRECFRFNGRLNFTVEGGTDNITFAFPYEHKDNIRKINTPTLYTLEAKIGDAYEITNSVNKRYSFTALTNTNTSDNILVNKLYYSNYGKLSGFLPNSRFSYSIDLSADSDPKFRFEVVSGFENLILYIPYDYKDYIKKYDKPLTYKFKLNPGEVLEMDNPSYLGDLFMSATMPYKSAFQIGNITYKDNKYRYYEMKYYEPNDSADYYLTTAPMGKDIVIPFNYNDPIDIEVPYEQKENFKTSNNKYTNEYIFKIGDTFEYTNKNNKSFKLNLTGLYYGFFNYKVFDRNGTLIYKSSGNTRGINLEPGETIVLDSLENVDSLNITIAKDFENTVNNYSSLDINLDNSINILDLSLIANKYNLSSSDELYLNRFDLNTDGIIDIFDLTKLSSGI